MSCYLSWHTILYQIHLVGPKVSRVLHPARRTQQERYQRYVRQLFTVAGVLTGLDLRPSWTRGKPTYSKSRNVPDLDTCSYPYHPFYCDIKMLWCSKPLQHAFFLLPSFLYNPFAAKDWTKNPDIDSFLGSSHEMFYAMYDKVESKKTGICYAGTYTFRFVGSLTPKEFKQCPQIVRRISLVVSRTQHLSTILAPSYPLQRDDIFRPPITWAEGVWRPYVESQ